MRRRAERYEIIREMLLKGKTVAYRQSTWSLHPRVSSNNLCSYIPVRYPEQVNKGDVVFCIVQPRGLYYARLVHTKEWNYKARKHKFWISNVKGRINGHCFIEHIYGKLVLVVE